jgi:quinol monooxygenase YgiN
MAFIALFQATAAPEHVDAVRDSVVRLAQDSRKESGTLRYEFYQYEDEPTIFLLFGIWESEEQWRAHVSGEAHRAHDARLPDGAWAIRPTMTRLQALEDIL